MVNHFKSLENVKIILKGCLGGIAILGFSTTTLLSMEAVSRKAEVRILAIEGEGVRAIIPLTVLDNIEEQVNEKVKFANYFDVIDGIESGARLVSEGLKTGRSADNLLAHLRDGRELAAQTTGVAGEDPTINAINQAEEKFPGSHLFIVTLGAGGVIDFDFNSPENVRKLALNQRIQSLKDQGRLIEHITINTTIQQSLAAPSVVQNMNSLRQVGLSLCNRQNPNGSYQNIQKVVKRMNNFTPE